MVSRVCVCVMRDKQLIYHLILSAVYGKTLESVRKRIDFRLCTNAQQLMAYTSRPLFKSRHIYGEFCVGVELAKTEVSILKTEVNIIVY